MSNYAIILAAGDGKRLGTNIPKCFIKINKKFIYQYSLELFEAISAISKIVLVVPKQYLKKLHTHNKRIIVVSGGKTRNDSFECGMKALKQLKPIDKIIVHDAARINTQLKDIVRIINSKLEYGTLCYLGEKNKSDLRIGRYNIQTPQFCTFKLYHHAIKNQYGKDLLTYLNIVSDKKHLIISSNKHENKKITFFKDINWAKSI